jgi:hypothetical protein
MGNSFLMIAALGGKIDRNRLQQLITTGNERRRKMFRVIADLLFGLAMFIWSGLDLKVQKSDGTEVDASDASVSLNDKVNALLAGLKSTHKSTLFREMVRPFLIQAAEMLATLMEPDPMMLEMIAHNGAGGGGLPALPGYVPSSDGGALPWADGTVLRLGDWYGAQYGVRGGQLLLIIGDDAKQAGGFGAPSNYIPATVAQITPYLSRSGLPVMPPGIPRNV